MADHATPDNASSLEQAEAPLHVYVIRHEGDTRTVEATTMLRAIELWQAHEALLADVEPSDIGDPDGCDLFDEMPVIRAAVLRPTAVGSPEQDSVWPEVGVLADLFDIVKNIREFGPVFADQARKANNPSVERIALQLFRQARAICEQIVAAPKGGAS